MTFSNSESFEVLEKHPEKGVGLFAIKRFVAGENIYRFDYWSKEQMPIHSTNHSCQPNASFNEKGFLVASRPIEKGEEITFNYLVHPLPASPWNFKCECESDNCIGWIDATIRNENNHGDF
jgi:SET domain-containing protein